MKPSEILSAVLLYGALRWFLPAVKSQTLMIVELSEKHQNNTVGDRYMFLFSLQKTKLRYKEVE
jgi:hypothetical protein